MSTDATTLVEAKEWCKEMRGTLKLSRKERGKLDLKSRSADAADNIQKLQGKVQPIVYDRLKGELLAVAGRIKAMKPTDPRGNLEVDAERLNVLACQSKALLKDDKSSQKDLGKALTSLGQSLVSHSPGGGSPEVQGNALAKQIFDKASAGTSVNLDVAAMNHLSKTADPGSDLQKTADVCCKEMIALNQAKGKALGRSEDVSEGPRMPSEVMVHLLASVRAEMKTNPNEDLKKLERSVNAQIMSHKLTVADTRKFLGEAKDTCDKAGSAKLKDLCGTLTKSLPATDADAPVTRLQDNIYGRVFDSALAANLIQAPPASVQQAQKATSAGFGEFLKTVKPEIVADCAAKMQGLLKGEDDHEDPRFWAENVPGLQKLRDAKPEDAVAALNEFLAADKTSGPECMAVPWLLVKMSLTLKEVATEHEVEPKGLSPDEFNDWSAGKNARIMASCPWMKKANDNYQAIAKQKSNTKPGDVHATQWNATNAQTEGSGITLKHQPNATENEGYTNPSTRPANLNLPGVKRDKATGEVQGVNTDAMQTALEHGLPYASGASGSTNIMLHLMEHMNAGGLAKIDPKDALLGTTMFLIADGGHSLQEVLYTANAMDAKLDLKMGFKGGKPEEFVADYSEFVGMYGDSESGKALQGASDAATNRVAEYFEENSAYSEQDKGSAVPVKTDWPGGKKPTTDASKSTDTSGGTTGAKTGTGEQPKKPLPPRPQKPQAPKDTATVPVPEPAELVIGNLNANPTLWFIVNKANGKNFRVDSANPGAGWQKVEQFCAYLAAYWLANNKTGSFKFADLGSAQDDAVQTLIGWGSSGGLAAQVGYAEGKIGGKKVDKGELLNNAKTGALKAGMKIWFGSDGHSRAASVNNLKMVTVYEPNDGSISKMTGADFANIAAGDNTFVVAGG
jgi:hypothetical protein